MASWVEQYGRGEDRFKCLVLRAASRCGKSTLAKSLGRLFNLGRAFTQTVQDAEAPDLRQFSHYDSGYIVFDNVNNMDFVLNNRALFQANNDLHTLGESRTGIYSYQVWLYRVPIVVTVDMSARWNPQEPWIRDNVFEIFMQHPCYLPPPA